MRAFSRSSYPRRTRSTKEDLNPEQLGDLKVRYAKTVAEVIKYALEPA
ncbi:MAG: hypothetical protein R2748_21370 [Bryobacterales bacterium]